MGLLRGFMIDFTDKNYTDVMELYDNWNSFDAIIHTFKNRNLAICKKEEFFAKVNVLLSARQKYPTLALNEAYKIESGTGIVLGSYPQIYKGIVAPQSSRGLGDTIAKITHATGLDKLSQIYTSITGQPCGCASRQEALNKLIPYNIKEES
jgi:hypothetical protein